MMRGLTGLICWKKITGHSIELRQERLGLDARYYCRFCGEQCDLDDQGSNLKLIAATIAVIVAFGLSIFLMSHMGMQ
jgi:hypothetical protein